MMAPIGCHCSSPGRIAITRLAACLVLVASFCLFFGFLGLFRNTVNSLPWLKYVFDNRTQMELAAVLGGTCEWQGVTTLKLNVWGVCAYSDECCWPIDQFHAGLSTSVVATVRAMQVCSATVYGEQFLLKAALIVGTFGVILTLLYIPSRSTRATDFGHN